MQFLNYLTGFEQGFLQRLNKRNGSAQTQNIVPQIPDSTGALIKTCVKRPLKIDKTKILITIGSLMKVESIAILLTCIK